MIGIVLAVAVIQLVLLVLCVGLAREDDAEAFVDLRERFDPDIVARARRGDAPDWLRYLDDADRIHERRSDQLRVYATAALVIGIGGTMLALAVNLPSVEANDQSLGSLIAAMSSALFASLSGVFNNLLISLWLLRSADNRFAVSLDDFKRRLQDTSAEHPPHETFADAVKSQLGDAFREAVHRFPEAFERLDENVESLAAVIEQQSTSVHVAATHLRESADGLAAAAAGIAPAAAKLAASTDQLRTMPEQLGSTLDATRDAWKQEMRHDRSAFIEGVKEVLTDQQALLERTKDAFDEWESKRRDAAEAAEARWREFVTTVQSLPDMFAAEVEKVSSTLGRQFGVEARNHVQDLVQKIEEGNETLRAQVDRATRELQTVFLNNTGDVVAGTLKDVYQHVESTLLASLDEVGRGLKEALTDLPNNARGFAQSLSDADQKLQQALDGIRGSSEKLANAAKFTDDFEGSLTRALTSATAEEIRKTHADINGMVESLIEFIRSLVERLARQGDRP